MATALSEADGNSVNRQMTWQKPSILSAEFL